MAREKDLIYDNTLKVYVWGAFIGKEAIHLHPAIKVMAEEQLLDESL